MLEGLSWTGRTTFAGRTKALKLLLENTGQCGMQTPTSVWDARLDVLPDRVWCPEQAEMLEIVARAVAVDDAHVSAHPRILATRRERVLIACPIGALVDSY